MLTDSEMWRWGRRVPRVVRAGFPCAVFIGRFPEGVQRAGLPTAQMRYTPLAVRGTSGAQT